MTGLTKHILLLIIITINCAYCQETPPPKTIDTKPYIVRDSLILQSVNRDSVKNMIIKPIQMKKSPWEATWRSLVLPGWGQIYTESYWKAPIFIGATGTLLYLIIDNNSKFIDAQNNYNDLLATEPQSTNLQILKSQKEYYRDNRDMSIFFLAGVYILAVVDAYSDAHLYDFNVSDDVTLAVFPSMRNGISLNLQFNINKYKK